MCYFCYAQLFEITHLTNIKSTLVQHSCRNAEVVEAFCRVAASRSNTRRSIHQPSVAALHAPAEMPTALSSILRYQTLHVASCPRRAYHRERPALNPHSARCLAGAQLPATSCLGAFRPPATSSCGGSRDPGVRKPAQQRSWPASRVGTDGRRGERRRCCVSGWRREATLIHPVTHRSEGCQRRSLARRVDNSRLTM